MCVCVLHQQGEYFVKWKEIGPCPRDIRGTDEMQSNIRLTRKYGTTEVEGNYTFMLPLDDTIKVCKRIIMTNMMILSPSLFMLLPSHYIFIMFNSKYVKTR